MSIRLFPENLSLRVRLVKAAIVIAFGVGILLSQQLWISEGRHFPMLGPFDVIPVLSSPLDIIFLLIFLCSSTVWIFYEKRFVGWVAIGSLIVMLLQDQMRWQPWVYLYLLMLLPYLFRSSNGGNERPILTVLQWIIAGVYIWSGIHKLNPGFLNGTFLQFTNALHIKEALRSWKEIGYIIPIIEVSMGLALLTARFRKIGMYAAIITHIFILFFLSPFVLDHNSIVYPWNAAMIVFVYMLFGGVKDDLRAAIQEIRSHAFVLIPVALVWLFPLFNFFGYWDHYLSFSLYSGKPSKFYIAIEKNEVYKIDQRFENYFASIQGLQGGQLVDIDKWAYSELNVPFYPEARLFRKLGSNFCALGIDDDKLVFLELTYSNGKLDYNKFTCSELLSE